MVDTIYKHALHRREQVEPALILVTISHADWATDYRFVENDTDLTISGLVYSAGRVDIVLPSEGDVAGRGSLIVDNIDSVLAALIFAAEDSVQVKASIVMAGSPETPVKEWPVLDWENVEITARTLSGALVQKDYERELWPPRVMNAEDFPGANW